MAEVLLREDAGGLCRLTLNRPDKLNALNSAIFERLDTELADIEAKRGSIGCVVLNGAGRSFCAGADLEEFAGSDSLDTLAKARVVERLSNLAQPVIAMVHGHCLTGGLELALAADIIVTAESATFGDTHGKWGFIGTWGMTQRLPRRVGRSFASLMMFSAQRVAAPEAFRVGLADICVPDEELAAEVERLTSDILANSWHSLFGTKQLLAESEGMPLAHGLAHEYYRNAGPAPDWRERVQRFTRRT